jgi:hemoglobin
MKRLLVGFHLGTKIMTVAPACAAVALAVSLVSSPVVRAQAPAAKPTLYQRLGSYDGVASYVALVFPRVVQHPTLSHMFRGHGTDSQQRQFQLVVEMICEKTGGPCHYLGRPMPPVHDGLGITEENWTTFLSIITAGMDEKKYPPDVREEFLAVWRSFRSGVVEKQR